MVCGLVVGDGLALDEDDRRWMLRDGMDFRLKMHRDAPSSPWQQRVYVVQITETQMGVNP